MEVSSESGFDFGYIFVNDSQKAKMSGNSTHSYIKWPSSGYNNYDVTNGQIIEFKYSKDTSVSKGYDHAKFWVYAS